MVYKLYHTAVKNKPFLFLKIIFMDINYIYTHT